MLGQGRQKQKGMKSAGASPKGHGRPVRPMTAGGRHTPFLTGKRPETTQGFVQLGWMFGIRGGRQGEPVTLQQVSGTHSDRTAAEGHRRHF